VSTNNRLPETISDRFIDSVAASLAKGRRIRRNLPEGGRIRIDRQLPFLCLYRQPEERDDPGTRRLTRGEVSYMIAPGGARHAEPLSRLVVRIAETASAAFGAFFVIEIWASAGRSPSDELEQIVPAPRFTIFTSLFRPPSATVDALKTALAKIRVHRKKAVIEVVRDKRRTPPGMDSLILRADANRLNIFTIGLEIEPIYQNPETGDVYPLVLRILHRRLAHALKRAFFEFSRTQTSYHPTSHRALGHRACTNAVWEIDRRLAEIGGAYDFLLQVTPVNAGDAWLEFRENNFERPPVFTTGRRRSIPPI